MKLPIKISFANWTNNASLGQLTGIIFLILFFWLIGLMPLMPGTAGHIRNLFAFGALIVIIFALGRTLQRFQRHGYLLATLVSAATIPLYILLRQMFAHSEIILTLVVIAVCARWGRGPGLVSAILVWGMYVFTSGMFFGTMAAAEALFLAGFWIAAACVVGSIARHRELALAAQSQSLAELEQTYESTIVALSSALDARDHETEGHSERVCDLAQSIAVEMNLDKPLKHALRLGALLHDIGKIGVPDSILSKPSSLTEAEWRLMRQHPQIGYDILQKIPFLQAALDIVLYHHEKYNGAGYPRGLKGSAIPITARIFAVADVFDALTSDRPYRVALSIDAALIEILAQSGKHFDPKIVQVFGQIISRQTHS